MFVIPWDIAGQKKVATNTHSCSFALARSFAYLPMTEELSSLESLSFVKRPFSIHPLSLNPISRERKAQERTIHISSRETMGRKASPFDPPRWQKFLRGKASSLDCAECEWIPRVQIEQCYWALIKILLALNAKSHFLVLRKRARKSSSGVFGHACHIKTAPRFSGPIENIARIALYGVDVALNGLSGGCCLEAADPMRHKDSTRKEEGGKKYR